MGFITHLSLFSLRAGFYFILVLCIAHFASQWCNTPTTKVLELKVEDAITSDVSLV